MISYDQYLKQCLSSEKLDLIDTFSESCLSLNFVFLSRDVVWLKLEPDYMINVLTEKARALILVIFMS